MSYAGPPRDQIGPYLADKMRKEAEERQRKQDEAAEKRRNEVLNPRSSS